MTTNLGKKYVCYSCQTKYYDLGKPQPVCPKCGANPRDEDHPAPVTRGRRAVVVEPEEEAFEESSDEPAADEEEDAVDEPNTPAKDDDDDDEEEE